MIKNNHVSPAARLPFFRLSIYYVQVCFIDSKHSKGDLSCNLSTWHLKHLETKIIFVAEEENLRLILRIHTPCVKVIYSDGWHHVRHHCISSASVTWCWQKIWWTMKLWRLSSCASFSSHHDLCVCLINSLIKSTSLSGCFTPNSNWSRQFWFLQYNHGRRRHLNVMEDSMMGFSANRVTRL